MLLVTTNTHEGTLFVNQTILGPVNYTFPQYVSQLFPRMNEEQIQHVVSIYSTSGSTSTLEQAAAVMGDSEWSLICFAPPNEFCL